MKTPNATQPVVTVIKPQRASPTELGDWLSKGRNYGVCCGFEFSETKLNKPSQCPKCHGTWVLEPKIGIKQST